ALRDAGGGPGRRRLPDWARPVVALVLSSVVAGAATAPIAAAHFNILAKYGLLANLATVPLMGALVIPAGVLSLLLMPLGWEAPALWLMGQGAGWILFVAERIAGLEGAVRPVPSPGWPVLPLIAGGGALALLWPGGWKMRAAGLLPVAGALVLWWQAERPVLLVAEDGALVGVMTPGGRALSRPRGAGFAAGI
ncbi:competence protein, partial [Aquicoccus sp. SCR17]|nr:competence protein [Carideicomes alvinocaridis]